MKKAVACGLAASLFLMITGLGCGAEPKYQAIRSRDADKVAARVNIPHESRTTRVPADRIDAVHAAPDLDASCDSDDQCAAIPVKEDSCIPCGNDAVAANRQTAKQVMGPRKETCRSQFSNGNAPKCDQLKWATCDESSRTCQLVDTTAEELQKLGKSRGGQQGGAQQGGPQQGGPQGGYQGQEGFRGGGQEAGNYDRRNYNEAGLTSSEWQGGAERKYIPEEKDWNRQNPWQNPRSGSFNSPERQHHESQRDWAGQSSWQAPQSGFFGNQAGRGYNPRGNEWAQNGLSPQSMSGNRSPYGMGQNFGAGGQNSWSQPDAWGGGNRSQFNFGQNRGLGQQNAWQNSQSGSGSGPWGKNALQNQGDYGRQGSWPSGNATNPYGNGRAAQNYGDLGQKNHWPSSQTNPFGGKASQNYGNNYGDHGQRNSWQQPQANQYGGKGAQGYGSNYGNYGQKNPWESQKSNPFGGNQAWQNSQGQGRQGSWPGANSYGNYGNNGPQNYGQNYGNRGQNSWQSPQGQGGFPGLNQRFGNQLGSGQNFGGQNQWGQPQGYGNRTPYPGFGAGNR